MKISKLKKHKLIIDLEIENERKQSQINKLNETLQLYQIEIEKLKLELFQKKIKSKKKYKIKTWRFNN